jgi:hypothetical protein
MGTVSKEYVQMLNTFYDLTLEDKVKFMNDMIDQLEKSELIVKGDKIKINENN